MAQVINTNFSAINAQRNLQASQGTLQTAIQRLSSGLRVNSAKDDAAGLAISERMLSQTRGMTAAARNASDGISLAQVAEGHLGQIGDTLQRMRELAVQSANGTNNTGDRANLESEFDALRAELRRVIDGATFNNVPLFNAAASTSGFSFQIGANNVSTTDRITVTSADLVNDAQMGSGGTLINTGASSTGASISSMASAQAALDLIDTAITTVTTQRANWGAMQNRFEAVISNLNTTNENLTAAKSRIIDADFASETMAMTRAQILQQAGTAMLAQANQVPQGVLQLLQG